jgi:large subunit ribosomal protein LP0
LEIISPTKILVIGQKISMSEINLMKKFNIKPYKHFVQIKQIYLNGKVYGSEILKINDNYLRERVERGITNVTALSLRLGVPNRASAVHTISNCFRNLAGLGAATNSMFRQAEGLVGSSAPAQASAPAKEEKKETKKKEEPKKEEPTKEEVEDEPLGLFDF